MLTIKLKKEQLAESNVRFVPATPKDAALLPEGFELRGRRRDDGTVAVQMPTNRVAPDTLSDALARLGDDVRAALAMNAELRRKLEGMLDGRTPVAEVEIQEEGNNAEPLPGRR